MARKRIHKYPDFIIVKRYLQQNGKRYFLELEFDNDKPGSIVVILKNPSKATDKYSDHTVNRVSNFIYKNRRNYDMLRDIGKVVILNLTPFYETESHKLKNLTETIIENKNLMTIDKYLQQHKTVIIAWGDHPRYFYEEYQNLKEKVFDIFKRYKNEVYYVNSFSLQGNPRHGQVWGYTNELLRYISDDSEA